MTGPQIPGAAPAWQPRFNPWLIAVVVLIPTFMEVLDTTIANVALPHMAGTLGAGYDESTWVLTSYMVANAIVLPVSGWLSALIGRKRFYMLCIVLFSLASLACGFAQSLEAMVLFRTLQGLAGGGMQPAGQAILVDTFPPEKRGMAFALAGVAFVLAPAVGPTLGGYITDSFDWRWIFFINIPVGIVSLMFIGRLVEDSPNSKRISLREGMSIDYIGLGLIALGLGCLQLTLDKGQREDWFESPFIVTTAATAALGLAAAVWWELKQKHPVTDLRLFRDRNFAIGNLLIFCTGFLLYGSTVLVPLLLQTRMDYSATWAGLALSPGALLVIAILPIAGRLVNVVPPGVLIVTGLLLTGSGMWHFSRLDLQTDYMGFMLARCLMVSGLPFLFIAVSTAAFSRLTPEQNNNASAIFALSRNLGGSVGIAVVTTVLAQRQQVHQNELVEHLSGRNPEYAETLARLAGRMREMGYDAVTAAEQAQAIVYHRILGDQTAILAYLDNFRLLAVISICLLPLALLVRRRPAAGDRVAGEP